MQRTIASACLLLTFVLAFHASGQAQKRNDSKSKSNERGTVNHPPKINSFKSSAGTLPIPCPWWDAPFSISCSPSPTSKVSLTTDASDPDGDTLKYEYSITGGQITGEGAQVIWDYYKLSPGSYTVKVIVSDQHGGVASASISLSVIPCPICDPPCPTISISCPSDAEEEIPLTFSVNVSGGDPNVNLTYNWTVSAGTIVSGQGTPTIAVDTRGLKEKLINATIEIGGFRPECDRTRSCEVQIHKKAEKEEQ